MSYQHIVDLLKTIGTNEPVNLTNKTLIDIGKNNTKLFPRLENGLFLDELSLLMDKRAVFKLNQLFGLILDKYKENNLFINQEINHLLQVQNYQLCLRLVKHSHSFLSTIDCLTLILGFDNQSSFLELAVFPLNSQSPLLKATINKLLMDENNINYCDLFSNDILGRKLTISFNSFPTTDFYKILKFGDQYSSDSYLTQQKNMIHQLFKSYNGKNLNNQEFAQLMLSLKDIYNRKVPYKNETSHLEKLLNGKMFSINNVQVLSSNDILGFLTLSFDIIPNIEYWRDKFLSEFISIELFKNLPQTEQNKYQYLFEPKTIKMEFTFDLANGGFTRLSTDKLGFALLKELESITLLIENHFKENVLWNSENVTSDMLSLKNLMLVGKLKNVSYSLLEVIETFSHMDNDFKTNTIPTVLIQVNGYAVHPEHLKLNLLKQDKFSLLNGDTLKCDEYKVIYLKLNNPSETMVKTIDLLKTLKVKFKLPVE